MNAPASPVSPGLLDEAPVSLPHAAAEAIVTIDESQRIVMINPAAQRMFGCTAAEALGSELTRFIPLRYRGAHAGHVRRFEASGLIGAVDGRAAAGDRAARQRRGVSGRDHDHPCRRCATVRARAASSRRCWPT